MNDEPVAAAATLVSDPASVALSGLQEAARGYAAAATSAATRRAYRADVATFVTWCAGEQRAPLPALPSTVALYLARRAQLGKRASTITRAASAIAAVHVAAGHRSPCEDAGVRAVLKGIRRTLGTARRQKSPLLAAELRQLVGDELGEGARAARDRALLLLGFFGAFRRSELVGLDVGDVAVVDEGLVVTLRGSKTDQERAGERVGIPRGRSAAGCPARAVKLWLELVDEVDAVDAGGDVAGRPRPLFRAVTRHGRVGVHRLSGDAVALIVQRVVATSGKDPRAFGGHSLRAGFVTSAAQAGKAERDIMRQSRHRSVITLRGYIRGAELFTDNAGDGLLEKP